MTIYSAAILLFLVMDPLGNVPVFLTVLKDVPLNRRRKIIIRELLISLVILIVFLFLGKYIMAALQLHEPSLSLAGGIILFLIALRMIFPNPQATLTEQQEREPFIVPLAVPLVAGPSALAIILLLATKDPNRILDWLFALICAWLVSVLILVSSSYLSRALGKRGLIAMERLMGMLLTAISVQMLLNGIEQFLNRA